MSQQISVRFENEIKDRLANLSKASNRPVAQIIRQCVIDHLEDLEDVYMSLRVLETPGDAVLLSDMLDDLDREETH